MDSHAISALKLCIEILTRETISVIGSLQLNACATSQNDLIVWLAECFIAGS